MAFHLISRFLLVGLTIATFAIAQPAHAGQTSCTPLPTVATCRSDAWCWEFANAADAGEICREVHGTLSSGATCFGAYNSGCLIDCGTSSQFISFLPSGPSWYSEAAAKNACTAPGDIWLGN